MTKKITFVVLSLISCSLIANGQIKEKSFLLGGQLSYYNTKQDFSGTQPEQKDNGATFNVSIGKAVKENSVYGFNISYEPNKTSYFNGSNNVNSTENQFEFGIFNRQYHQLVRDFYFFTETGVAFITSKQTNTPDTQGAAVETIRQSGGQLTLTPGLSYRILNKLHLEIVIPNIINIQYSVQKDDKQTGNQKQTQFSFNSSLNSMGLDNLSVGFHFIL